MSEEFAGKVVLVTGGGKGVGRAIAREFAARGAHVVINYFHSDQAARATQQDIAADGGSSELIRASVAKPEAVAAMFDTVRQRTGRLDVLVNNAARGVLASADTLTDLEWQKVFEVNVHGARRCAWAALPLLSEVGGSVVNVSSIGAGMVIANYAVVGVSKAALEALSRYLAVEFAPHGVRVNVASAGFLDNPTADLFPGSAALRDNCAVNTPLGRLGTESELASLVTMLASPRAGWITGQTVLADGGFSVGHAMFRPSPPPAADGGPPVVRPPQESGDVAKTSEVRDLPSPAPRRTGLVRTSARHVRNGDEDADDTGTVAVVGMGLVVPGADDPPEFWELLTDGEPVFGQPGERFRHDAFWAPSKVEDRGYTFRGGYIREPRLHQDAKSRSCAHDMSAQWLRHSIAQAYEKVVRLPEDRVECFVGSAVEWNQHWEESLLVETALQRIVEHWPRSRTGIGAPDERLRALLRGHYPFATDVGRSHLADEVVKAAITDLLPPGSPYLTVDTACSSGLYAVDLGLKAILSGSCDIAVCGGVSANTVRFMIMFGAMGGLSPSGAVRAFDQAADGTLFSDGAGAVVLKSLRRARRDGDEVLAVLGGFGAASDGRGKGIYAPSQVGQELAVRRARRVNGVEGRDIDWVVAHGTGTALGDRVELGTLDALAPDTGYACTSNKSLVGHTGWPAGVISLIHAILGLRHERIPAQRPLTELSEDARDKRVHIPPSDLRLPLRGDRARVVGVSAFGIGGTDAHLLVQDVPHPEATPPRSAPPFDPDDVVLVGWSAHLPGDPSPEQLRTRLAARAPLTPRAAFPTPYPAPPARSIGMAPRTVRTVDRCQLMALAVATRFAEEHGHLWKGLEDRTGVLAAHAGSVGSTGTATMRCYANDLLNLRVDPDDEVSPHALEQAVRDSLERVREERPPTNEDSLAGLNPNIIPARLAKHLDLNGPALTLDTGASSALTAVQTASRYLATREIDLALVLAMNGNSTPEMAALLGHPVDHLAEGAFLLALARKRDALAKGWPVLCRVTTDSRPERAPASVRSPRPRTYLGADGAVDLLSALADRPREPVTVTGPFPGPAVTLHPVEEGSTPRGDSGDARLREPGQVTGVAAPNTPAPPREPLTRRHVLRLEPQPEEPETSAVMPADCLVLTDEATAAAITAPATAAGATVLVVRPGDDPDIVLEPVARSGSRYRHLRVYTSWTGEPGPPTPLLALHEVMFLAAQRHEGGLAEGGSLGVLLVDPMRRGAPGAHTGLFTGFVKSLAWELPGCACRAVVSDEPAGDSWRTLETELSRTGGLPVVTYRSGTRYRQRLCPAPPTAGSSPLEPGDVVVATGGARGITAAVVEALLERMPLKVWLLGSSSPADVPPDLLAAADDDLPGHRAEFIARGLRAGEGSSVADLNRRFERLLHARESSLTLARMRERRGDAAVRYLTCDVTDAAAVRGAVETVFRQDGRVDLLVNGAGLHHAGELKRKELGEFRRVRDVKLRGYQHLKEAFSGRPPAVWCNFGSVAGLVGLPGEVEYASANDFLGCAATQERAVFGHNEYTLAWTVWDEVGLGGNAVARSLMSRAQRLTPTSTKEGAAHFITELAQRGPRDAVVTFIGDRERESFARQFPGYLADLPSGMPDGYFLSAPESREANGATWRLVLGERHERLLRDHLVDGRPTVPGTMLAEIAVEAARALLPGEVFRALRDLSFSSWVRPAPGRRGGYRVTASVNRPKSAGARPSVLVRIASDVTTAGGEVLRRDREHFRATVVAGPSRNVHAPVPMAEDHPVRSPYYHPESRVLLSGPFRTTCEWSAGPSGTSARWRPDPARLPAELARLALPSLLLDGLARTRALRPVTEGVHDVEVPRHIRRIEWCTDDSDVDLAGRHPEGIWLGWDAATGLFHALAPDGTVLALMEDAWCTSMGRVRTADDGAVRARSR